MTTLDLQAWIRDVPGRHTQPSCQWRARESNDLQRTIFCTELEQVGEMGVTQELAISELTLLNKPSKSKKWRWRHESTDKNNTWSVDSWPKERKTLTENMQDYFSFCDELPVRQKERANHAETSLKPCRNLKLYQTCQRSCVLAKNEFWPWEFHQRMSDMSRVQSETTKRTTYQQWNTRVTLAICGKWFVWTPRKKLLGSLWIIIRISSKWMRSPLKITLRSSRKWKLTLQDMENQSWQLTMVPVQCTRVWAICTSLWISTCHQFSWLSTGQWESQKCSKTCQEHSEKSSLDSGQDGYLALLELRNTHQKYSAVLPNSKHWFTTSFLQPLPCLVMP